MKVHQPSLKISRPEVKQTTASGTTKNGQVVANLRTHRSAVRRKMMNLIGEREATAHIGELPEQGESIHMIVDSRFEPFDMIPAARTLMRPATIKRLDITTLSFNIDNIARLCTAIDAGKVGKVLLVCSIYFAKQNATQFQYAVSELAEKRNATVAARRIHSKIILMETTDRRHFVIEGSGNLRSCRSIEQFCITHDRELLMFHRRWIEDYIRGKGD